MAALAALIPAVFFLVSTAESLWADSHALLQFEVNIDRHAEADPGATQDSLSELASGSNDTVRNATTSNVTEKAQQIPVIAGSAPNKTSAQNVPVNASSSNASGWCGFRGHPGFITAYTLPSTDNLLLDLTEGLQENRSVRFVVTAMTILGTYLDGRGYMTEFASPMEETDSTMFELKLNKDGISVDAYRPQLGLRTSDREMKNALRRGTGSGHFETLNTFRCAQRGASNFASQVSGLSPSSLVRLSRGGLLDSGVLMEALSRKDNASEMLTVAEDSSPAKSAGGKRIVVSGGSLIRKGFWVVNKAQEAVSYSLLSVKAYKTNLDVAVEYMMSDGVPLSVGYSIVRLPERPMQGRPADDRLLYFTMNYEDLGQHSRLSSERPEESVNRKVSTIWRYNIPALPNKQIRIHIDPTVPKRWRSWFRQGVEAWNDAFKEIGQPNAVRAVLPEDADWPKDYDISDARFSTISWTISSQVVSMGIAKVDPRSGEILKSDIIMSDGWVRSWLGDLDLLAPNFTHQLNQASGYRFEAYSDVDLFLNRRHLPQPLQEGEWGKKISLLSLALGQPITATERDNILGQGLRHVVTHETGHILGLRHNFKGSLGVSYACTRSASCTAVRGLTASVMDYIPVNYPSKDAPDVHLFSPVLGDYDKLAIRYGYAVLPEIQGEVTNNSLSTRLEQGVDVDLNAVLSEAENFATCYDADRMLGQDPMCAAYDMSADPLRYFEDELRRLIDVQRNLLNTSVPPGAPYTHYGDAVSSVLHLAQSIGVKVIEWLGGVNNQYVYRRMDGLHTPRVARHPVPLVVQKKAMGLLLAVLRPGKAGLLPPAKSLPFLVASRGSGSVESLDVAGIEHRAAKVLLRRALAPRILARLNEEGQETRGGLPLGEYLDLFTSSIFREGVKSSTHREWNLQRLYVSSLAAALDDALPGSALAHVRRQLHRLHKEITAGLREVEKLSKSTSSARQPEELDVLQAHLFGLSQDLRTAICSEGASAILGCPPA